MAFHPAGGFFGHSFELLTVSNMSEIEEGLKCKVRCSSLLLLNVGKKSPDWPLKIYSFAWLFMKNNHGITMHYRAVT